MSKKSPLMPATAFGVRESMSVTVCRRRTRGPLA
jgi:hypothetical protein